MTQIFGSVAYCREKDLTLMLSDRMAATPVSVEISPSRYVTGIETHQVCKVKVAGNHIIGLGGRYDETLHEGDVFNSISGIPNHGEAYRLFLDAVRRSSASGSHGNTYVFGTFNHRPRFTVGTVYKGSVVREEQRDTCALHRDKISGVERNRGLLLERGWLNPDWFRRTVYEERAFKDGKYMPTLDLMSYLFTTEMLRESDVLDFYVSRDWDVFVEAGGKVSRPFVYRGGLENQADFLKRVRITIEVTDDEFLREVYLRAALGGLWNVSLQAHQKGFPPKYLWEDSPLWDTFKLIMDGEKFPRVSMSAGDIERFLQYMKTVERFFLERQ
ncbi:MAG: hypothetical protein HYW26_05080 [Candidatus Aenigmarchaeota archaeon]|nr:hypothetical protein [Candidatus Aenigmarchaeota archaeon]